MRHTIVVAALLTSAAFGQKVDTEGKAWLSSKTESPAINVNGKWYAGEWGFATLNQVEGNRSVTGRLENRDVTGVVSGKSVYLLVVEKNKIMYSIEVASEAPNMLNGRYADGTSWNSGTRLMHMTRADGPSPPCGAAGSDRAQVVVYREAHYVGKLIKPSFYCDDQEAALVYKGCYFTISLSPGRHYLSSSDQYSSVPLDAKAGATYYVKVSLGRSEGLKTVFKAELVDPATALKMLPKLKPAKDSHLTLKDIVTTDLPK